MAALIALGGSLLGAAPAMAADSGVELTLTQRWNGGQQGAWTPYVATVRNDGASDFTGDITLHPVENTRGPSVQSWPDYHARLTVPRGSERSITFYVVEPPSGYQASLSDGSGHAVAGPVTVSPWVDGAYTVAVLSDQPQAGGRIEALKPLSGAGGFQSTAGLRASRFSSAQDFPANAVFLSGLGAVVVDDFDVSTLSDAQVRALRDFVGLGGSLVAAGGSSWRRTLLPLAQKGFPGLHPTRSGEAGLQPLADLAGRTTTLAAPVAAGELVAARALLGAAGAVPLAVEAGYGAGRIVELAFDPLAEPVSTDGSGLDQLAWSLALDRALLDRAPEPGRGPAATTLPPAPNPVSISGGGVASAEEVVNILQNTPAATLPPIGLLGALLVIYVALAGPLNYVVLRGFRRRELMWVSVPLVALLFTSVAYVAGAAVHGSNYFDNELQVLRLGPDGVAEVHAYHGLYPPHRGNFTVEVPANTLASTALGNPTTSTSSETAVVSVGPRTRVELKDTAYASYRSLQTLAIARSPLQPAIALESHLRISHDRVMGTVRNTGDRPVERLALVSGTGQQAQLAVEVAPRATLTVDAPLSPAGQGAPSPTAGQLDRSGDYKRQLALRVAAGRAVTGRAGDWSLIGLTDPAGSLAVEGARPAHSGLAALVAPAGMESVDSLGLAPRAELVLGGSAVPYHFDVFDLAVPTGYTGQVRLGYDVSVAGTGVAQPVRSVEVYDWESGGWRTLPASSASPSLRSLTATLSPSEVEGAVRVRVSEQASFGTSNMRLVGS